MTRGRCRQFSFETLSREQVLNQIRKSPNKASMGRDDISYEVLKMLDIYVAGPLMDIINLSLETRRYPSLWSVSVLKPLFKGSGKDSKMASSYRPVSLLCAMSQVLEALLNTQMNSFSEEAGILHPGVHGYREGMSTVIALMEIQSRLVGAVEEGKIASLCLLDVSSGFDSVNHTYLLHKLEMYGYDNRSLEWIHSYSSKRRHTVQVQAERSNEVEVDIGFPQGGPSSPVLFREYANDIPGCIHSQ